MSQSTDNNSLSPAGYFERNWPFVLVLMLLPAAAVRFYGLDLPFDADYMTQRLLFASLDLKDILLHNYPDQRHPQLFYLLMHPVVLLGRQEWLVRLPAAVISMVTPVVAFFFLRARLGAARALAAAAVVGFSWEFLRHSRDVSDVSLFITLALLNCLLLLKAHGRPSRSSLGALVAAQTAMFYSYYLSLLVLVAEVLALFWQQRAEKNVPRRLWLALGVSVALAAPAWVDFAGLVLADMKTRQLAAAFPGHIWGQKGPVEMLGEVAGVLFPAGWEGIVASVASAAGLVALLVSRADAWKRLVLCNLAVGAAAIVASVMVVRMQPYYFLYLLPFIAAAALCRTEVNRTGILSGVAGFLFKASPVLVAAAFCMDCYVRLPALTSAAGRDHFARLQEFCRDPDAPDTIVVDPDMLHTIVLYYCFDDPLAAYRGCRWQNGPVECGHGARRLVTLTAMASMTEGWQQRAVERFEAIARQPVLFVYTEKFENPPLLGQLRERCREVEKMPPLVVFLCGK
ncbi:MAG: hypothetical protein D6806_10970 [Deltaproteobacteria bacterium]|nr:MAG: hypothetical protein D6806_10970 [Deltaproteobacteria bacterium]